MDGPTEGVVVDMAVDPPGEGVAIVTPDGVSGVACAEVSEDVAVRPVEVAPSSGGLLPSVENARSEDRSPHIISAVTGRTYAAPTAF